MDKEDEAGLLAGLREAVDDIKARKADYVKEVRAKTQLSQRAFAERFHINLRTLQNWEGGKPIESTGQVLLRLIERDPKTVDHLLNE